MAPESSASEVPISSTGVKRGRAALDSGAPSGKRRKKTSRSPYVGWSGGGLGDQGSLPLRLGKMLGSFGSQIGSQNATDIGRNLPWASQPTVPGELGRNFGWDFRDQPCNMSPIC